MFKLRGRFIGAIGGLALVAGGLASSPVITAHASGCVTGSGVGLDPIISQSDLLATPSAAYTWAGVSSYCVTNPGTAAPSGNPEADITINLAGTIPSFPDARGDLGFTAAACSDVTGPMASHDQPIGINHRGQPVFDGPYPPEDGYKICAYVTVQAATPTDYGLEFFDPTGNFTFFDYPELCDLSKATAAPCGAGAPTILAPTVGANSITLHLPQNLTYTVNPPINPPFQGIQRNWSEPITTGSPNLQNTFALMQVQAEVTLPRPVCVNLKEPGIDCDGREAFGPVFGIVGLLVTSGWAPGTISCNTLISVAGEAIPNPATCTASGTGGFANGVDLGILPLPPNAQAIEMPCADPLDSPAVVDCATEVGTSNYFPCQSTNTSTQDVGDLYALTTGTVSALPCPVSGSVPLPYEYLDMYGRIWPGEPQIPRVAGFTIGPAFLPTAANF